MYTLQEARELLPWLRDMGRRLRDRKAHFDRHQHALRLLGSGVRSGDDHLNEALERHQARASELAEDIRALFAALAERGVECKGIDQGLFDVRSLFDGRVVYLCWQMDEPDIGFWHDLDRGFAGRQPLP